MECKVCIVQRYPSISCCFNLNLLECKGFWVSACYSTYFRFNLNLLECKEKTIYPIKNIIRVLISTYWNVKYTSIMKNLSRSWSFNLNLLECKVENRGLTIAREFGFNLNLLECKEICRNFHKSCCFRF